MKESEAWVILAEDFDARTFGTAFLCCILKWPNVYDPNRKLAAFPSPLRAQMVGRIKRALPPSVVASGGPAYDLGFGGRQEEHESRVLACLMFGEQAKDEERAK